MEPYVRHLDSFGDSYDARMLWQLAFLAQHPRDLSEYRPSRDNWGPLVVPPGKLFALGDNRDNSEDSRYWGFLDVNAIRGRPMFVYYSFRHELSPFPWMTGVRWDRIGAAIH